MTKPVLAISMTCMFEPGFSEWAIKASEIFKIVIFYPDSAPPPMDDVHLTISDRVMQFRGDWSAWWLEPEKLLHFKPWNQYASPPPCDPEGRG